MYILGIRVLVYCSILLDVNSQSSSTLDLVVQCTSFEFLRLLSSSPTATLTPTHTSNATWRESIDSDSPTTLENCSASAW